MGLKIRTKISDRYLLKVSYVRKPELLKTFSYLFEYYPTKGQEISEPNPPKDEHNVCLIMPYRRILDKYYVRFLEDMRTR